MSTTEQRPTLVPERESLIRLAEGVKLDPNSDGRTMVGYAAVFNEFTEIDSWEGHFLELIAPGAFRKTIRERADQIQVLFNHGMDPQIGDKPLGRIRTMKEDATGLYVEVPLDRTSYNEDILELLKSGALRGMSFRMTVPQGGDKWEDLNTEGELPKRTIREIKLMEFGPVTFPAYAATQAGVRAHAPEAFQAYRTATETPSVPSGTTSGDDGVYDPGQETPENPAPPPETEPAPATPDEDAGGPEDSTRTPGTGDEPAATEPTPQRSTRLTRSQLEMRLASISEALEGEQERAAHYERLVETYEAQMETS